MVVAAHPVVGGYHAGPGPGTTVYAGGVMLVFSAQSPVLYGVLIDNSNGHDPD